MTNPAVPPDPPPQAGLPWVMYALGGGGAAVAIFDFLLSVTGHEDKLTGGWLFFSMATPLLVLVVLVGYQAARFGSGLQAVTSAFAQELGGHVAENEGLRRELEDERSYVDLVRRVTVAARDLSRQVTEHGGPIENELLGVMLRRTCKDVADAFSRSIGESARVCIKQMQERGTEQRAYVQAICRSDGLSSDDPTRWDAVDENTDFNILFKRDADVWFSGDIEMHPGYRNSSPRPWTYRSVIVWPVIARTGRSDVESQSQGYDVAAFLCLDAQSPDQFEEERHVSVGWPLADAIGKAFEAYYLTFS